MRGMRKSSFFCDGLGGVDPLASCSAAFFSDEPGAPGHPGQDSAILDLRSLRQSLVGPIGMQTAGVFRAIKATDRTQTVAGMVHQRSSLQAQAPRATVGLATLAGDADAPGRGTRVAYRAVSLPRLRDAASTQASTACKEVPLTLQGNEPQPGTAHAAEPQHRGASSLPAARLRQTRQGSDVFALQATACQPFCEPAP